MAKPETRLLIFDFDGTLYDSLGGLHAAVNIIAKEKGVPEFDRDVVRSVIGYGLTNLLERLDQYALHKLGDVEALKARFREVYNEIALSESSLFPGVMEFLKSCPYQLAIVSNKEEFSLRKMVEGSPLSEVNWIAIYGGDSLAERKPSPLPIETVLEDAGLSANQAIFIGDGGPDAMASKAANVEFIGINFGYSDESELRQLGAHRFIGDFSELSERIQQVDASR